MLHFFVDFSYKKIRLSSHYFPATICRIVVTDIRISKRNGQYFGPHLPSPLSSIQHRWPSSAYTSFLWFPRHNDILFRFYLSSCCPVFWGGSCLCLDVKCQSSSRLRCVPSPDATLSCWRISPIPIAFVIPPYTNSKFKSLDLRLFYWASDLNIQISIYLFCFNVLKITQIQHMQRGTLGSSLSPP